MPIEKAKLGEGVKIWYPDLVNIYGCQIGAGTVVGPFVEIQKSVVIGERCTISSHSSICEGVTIEDEVFIGHGVRFVNEKHPEANRKDWTLPPENVILVKRGTTIGTGAIIMPGVTIGVETEVGAGALILDDVADYSVVVTRTITRELYQKDYNPTWWQWDA
jgi:UDP-2-acetamido-3-amino-2,3-dideoxy-glucuronate N-acetyltransferase